MNYSARLLGQRFGLNAQEMNMALKQLGYLDGQPGNYIPTEKGKMFYSETYHDNGYGGYAKRFWNTLSYDESIIGQLERELTNDVCQQAIIFVKEFRAAKKAMDNDESVALYEDIVISDPNAPNIGFSAQMDSPRANNLDIAAFAFVCIAATIASIVIGACKARRKRAKIKDPLRAKIKDPLNAKTIIEGNN